MGRWGNDTMNVTKTIPISGQGMELSLKYDSSRNTFDIELIYQEEKISLSRMILEPQEFHDLVENGQTILTAINDNGRHNNKEDQDAGRRLVEIGDKMYRELPKEFKPYQGERKEKEKKSIKRKSNHKIKLKRIKLRPLLKSK